MLRLPVLQRHDSPFDTAVIAGAVHGSEDMRSDRTVGIADGDRDIEDRLKSLPQIEMLRLAADEDRYRLKLVGELARLLGGSARVGLGGNNRLAGGRDRVQLGLRLLLGR